MNEKRLPDIEDLIPHRLPMRLIDHILEIGDGRLLALSRVKETWPLCCSQGADVILAIEIIAQSVAAYHHWKKGLKGDPQVGFLVGVKEARFYTQLLPLGAELKAEVKTVSVIVNYGIFNGEVRLGSEVVCEALLQAIEPHEEAFRKLVEGRRSKV